jgi:pimeloyl-ACP methyl ester carboxylesterase
MSRRALLIVAALTAGLAAGVPAAASAAPALRTCPGQPDFRCGRLAVPLDRTGAVRGSVRLRFAIDRAGRGRPLLVALSGGPGQSSVDVASSWGLTLAPLLRRHRLVVLDQRGTGRSGALRCPSVQRLRSLDPFTAPAVAACARRLGRRRASYTTADTVLDLDALRRALGAPRLALMGISYGTHVALQYARAFPRRTERLVLDSVVGPDGPDPFFLDTLRHLPRVLREQCSRGACRGVTRDPVADVAALTGRLARGPVRGAIAGPRGRPVTTGYRSAEEVLYLLLAGDLNPFLQAALPAALAAARAGDDTMLLRLRRAAQGRRTPVRDLSFGLNVTTGCTDGATPFPLAATVAERRALTAARLGAVPAADRGPFDAATVLASSYGDDCLMWPRDTVRPPSSGPLPDVPALLLGGALDLRTPVENAVATAALLPRSAVVRVAGTGHDVVDSDVTGCASRALQRFASGRAVGTPCAGRTNVVAPLPLPPRSLADFRAAPGVRGVRGRVLFATLETIEDARAAVLRDAFADVAPRGGGLRGGRYAASDETAVTLRGYAYLRGLRVGGRISFATGPARGTVRVRGPASGTLRLGRRGVVRGRLGGRAVTYRPRRGRAARLGAARRVRGPSYPVPVRLPRPPRLSARAASG